MDKMSPIPSTPDLLDNDVNNLPDGDGADLPDVDLPGDANLPVDGGDGDGADDGDLPDGSDDADLPVDGGNLPDGGGGGACGGVCGGASCGGGEPAGSNLSDDELPNLDVTASSICNCKILDDMMCRETVDDVDDLIKDANDLIESVKDRTVPKIGNYFSMYFL